MILMHEDWHRDTLEWSWICGRGTVAFTKRPLRNPTSGFLSRKEGRERERVYIIRGTGRQGELYGEPRRTTAIRHYISASRIYTAGPMIDAGDRGRQWPVNELTRIRYAIEDFERELLGYYAFDGSSSFPGRTSSRFRCFFARLKQDCERFGMSGQGIQFERILSFDRFWKFSYGQW